MRNPIFRTSSGRRIFSHLSSPGRAVLMPLRNTITVGEWVQGREWICQVVTEEFTRSQGFIPVQNSSQVSSLAIWLGTWAPGGFSFFSGPVNSEFPLAHEHFNRRCSLTAFWMNGIFWLLSCMRTSAKSGDFDGQAGNSCILIHAEQNSRNKTIL